jgi:hypothetical protein
LKKTVGQAADERKRKVRDFGHFAGNIAEETIMSGPDEKPTKTQPAPNISTEHPQGADDAGSTPTTTQPAPNISTEHQEEGDARRPGDGLDRGRPDVDDGRKSSLTKNA